MRIEQQDATTAILWSNATQTEISSMSSQIYNNINKEGGGMMSIAIEKAVSKLGPRIAGKYGPVLVNFLAANPGVVLAILLGTMAVGAIAEALEEELS